jgi:hypothetical protein
MGGSSIFSPMKNMLYFLGIVMVSASCNSSVKEDENLLQNLMRTQPEKFAHVLDSPQRYETQIIYTQINRDENNDPSFKSFYYNFDSSYYFYPASTVKFPSVLLALEKLNELNVQHLDKFTPMRHDSVYAGQLSVATDTTSENNMASVAHYVKKILVVSDNDAYNRLFEFLGQQAFNDRLHEKGYAGTRIIHRVERPLSADENAHTEAVTFFQKEGVVYEQPMLATEPYQPNQKIVRGRGYYKGDSLVLEAFDFSGKNFFPLHEQQRMLQAVLFPQSVPAKARFNLSAADRAFVLKYMSQLPTETLYPPYAQDTATYSDAYCKFFMYGGGGTIPHDYIRIFNKVGDAYGYLLDNAYIVDFKNNIEFMVTAVIHVNNDGIYNDGQYEYDKIGYPFYKNIGNLLYEYELARPRQHKPNLTEFIFDYDRKK